MVGALDHGEKPVHDDLPGECNAEGFYTTGAASRLPYPA
jgi:hypothetical protein